MTTRRSQNQNQGQGQGRLTEMERIRAENAALVRENKDLKNKLTLALALASVPPSKGDAASQAERGKKKEHEERQGKVINTKPEAYS